MCVNGTCQATPCTVQGCDQSACVPLLCLSAGVGDATAYPSYAQVALSTEVHYFTAQAPHINVFGASAAGRIDRTPARGAV